MGGLWNRLAPRLCPFDFDTELGGHHRYAVRELRIACPCASCRDEMTGERILDPSKVPEDVFPVNLSSVGNYGLKVRWSDGHDTGIYSFDRLRELGEPA